MTTWSFNAVAGFAKQAGFRGDSLATAVAVAMTASNGEDHRILRWSSDDEFVTAGLWQLPAYKPTPEALADLLNPASNAALAYGLWEMFGWDAQWCPTYQAGEWRQVYEVAKSAAANPTVGQEPANTLFAPSDLANAAHVMHRETLTKGRIPNPNG